MRTRYLKVFRDLTSDYRKNLMLVMAIAIGVFGIGSILGGYSVLRREMAGNYMGTTPASATIEIEGALTESIVDSVRKLPGIKEAERRATISARMKIEGKWYPLLLFVVDDFKNMRTNKFTHLSGAVEPPVETLLVERTALGVMQAKEGREIMVKTPYGQPKLLRISGTVHEPGLAPAWQEQSGYGYITLSTLHWLGETQGFDLLRILVSDNATSTKHISERAEVVAHWLEAKGYTVHEIQIPAPGRHPHQSQMNAVLSIFTIFSFMILILGSILVATSMATLMVRQVRQIGVMKTVGADSTQIMKLYAFMMIVLCSLALLVAIPLSRNAASAFYAQIAVLLNLEIANKTIPYWVTALQVGSGILIPMIAAAFPVVRGSRISVRKAMDNYGVPEKSRGEKSWSIRLSQAQFFSDTFKLSIRNVFRQQGRLVMTLGLLAAGGAMFMTALNVSDAWQSSLDRIYVQRLYDQEIKLNKAIASDSILPQLRAIGGVSVAEGWRYSSTSFVKGNTYNITNTYPDKGHGSFVMLAMPLPTKLLNPTMVEGHWLKMGVSNQVVLNQSARALAPNVKIGDEVALSIEGKTTRWEVVGFTEDIGSSSAAYVSLPAFISQTDGVDKVDMLRIGYEDRSKEYAYHKSHEIEALLERENISVSGSTPVWLLHSAIAGHMRVLVNSLLAMAVLMALVGTLGLMSTMSMNVMERTREIGVMRAIGATPKKIRNLVTWEGFLIGVLSLVIAFALSVLFSVYMGRFIGSMAFRTPLPLVISVLALAAWIGIVLVGSYLATLYPARRANTITTREALVYE